MNERLKSLPSQTELLTGPETQALLLRLTEFLQHSQGMGGNDVENTITGYIRRIQNGTPLTREEAQQIEGFFGKAEYKSTNYH